MSNNISTNPNDTTLNFSQQNLRNADFAGQNLAGSDFSGAQLQGANFSKANLDGANFTEASLSDGAYWPGDTATFAGASLRGATLDCSEISLVDFTSADLTGATAFGTFWLMPKIDGATMTGLRMEEGRLEALVAECLLRPQLKAMRTELADLEAEHGPLSDEAVDFLERLAERWRTSDLFEANEAADSYYADLVERLVERFGEGHPRTMLATAFHAEVGSVYSAETGLAVENALRVLAWSAVNPGHVNDMSLCVAVLRAYETELEDIEMYIQADDDEELSDYIGSATASLCAVEAALQRIEDSGSADSDALTERREHVRTLHEQLADLL